MLWCASSVVLYNLGLSRIGDYIGSEICYVVYVGYLIQISKFAIHIAKLEIWVNAVGLFKLQTK